MASTAIKRLQQDLKQLLQEPLVGAMAQPANDKDMMVWCGLVVGTKGTPLEGIPIRFCLEFSNEYPNVPPKAYFESYIKYIGTSAYDSKGRIEICLNIFSNFRKHESEGTGWSPSYNVSTILLSIQAILIVDMISTDTVSIQKMIDSALRYSCPITGHLGSDPSKWFPQIVNDPAVAASIADKYRKKDPQTTGVLQTFYRCYANRQLNDNNSTLGYGVHIENFRNGMLSSPCEYLSKESFINGNIRKSSTNKPFEHWLPILVRSEDWTCKKNIKNEFLIAVNSICSAFDFNGPDHTKVFKVCASLINSLVVEIMQNKSNATANDKFINGYFSIFRLLYTYANDDKQLIAYSNNSLKNFMAFPGARVKAIVPNLGDFLVHLTISQEFTWNQISSVFMSECDARNVFWYCIGNHNVSPAHPELINIHYKGDRATKVFHATAVSRKLVMYQIQLANVTKILDLEEFNLNFGLASETFKAELKNLFDKVTAVENWNTFYEFLQMPYITTEKRNKDLVQAVIDSAAQGYHKYDIGGKRKRNQNNNFSDKRRRFY